MSVSLSGIEGYNVGLKYLSLLSDIFIFASLYLLNILVSYYVTDSRSKNSPIGFALFLSAPAGANGPASSFFKSE